MRLQRNTVQWEEALDGFLLARAALPFVWGSNDCCTFAAGWLIVVRGEDPMADLRGYDTARGAARVLEGAGGLLAAVTARLGEPMPGTMAQRGDVALVRYGDAQQAMAVCTGSAFAAPGEQGSTLVPLTDAEAAWRV